MAMNTGQVLNGRYRIVRQLGEGGFGAVYRAWDINLNGPCAIKENFDASPAAYSQFAREASFLYNLRHPNLPRVIDHFSLPGQGQYLVMDYIEGEDLQYKLDQADGPLPEAQVLKWIMQVSDALIYLHSRTPPIIHRDIKPANIRITADGTAMLVDFGIAKIYDPERRTTLGAQAVTPGYSPFEQYGQKATDARTDVYALGATLYAALTGKEPPESIARVAGAPLTLPHTLNPAITPQTEAVILHAMEIMPDQRFQSLDDFRSALSGEGEFRAAVQLAASPPLPATAAARQGSPPVSGLPALDLLGAADQPPASKPASPENARASRRKLWTILAIVGGLGLLLCCTLLFLALISGGNGKATATPVALASPVSARASEMPKPTTPAPLPSPSLTHLPTVETQPPLPVTCTDPIGCVEISPGAPIHIAYALVVSGPNESLGIDSRNGIEIAIADRGQVLGHEIRLTGEDEGCSAEGGQAAGSKLAADASIVAVIGTSCSSAARVAVPLLSEAGFVIVSPSNTAPDLTEPGNNNNYPGYLRTAHNDKVQGAEAARFAWEKLGVKKAATIHDGSLYADKLQQVFVDEFRNMGGQITAQEAVDPNQTDTGPLLTRISAGGPELIYLPVFLPVGGFIIRQAKETAGLENTILMGADGLFSPDVVEAAGNAVEGFYVSSPFLSGSAYDAFAAKYTERFGKEPISIFHAHAYDATMLVFAVIENVAIQQPDGSLLIPRQALRDGMYGARDFPGLTGLLNCNPTGDCANPSIAVYQYHAGQYPPQKIWP